MTFRLAFVPGCTPDKWAGVWRERHRDRIDLTLIDEADQRRVLDTREADMVLARLPIERDGVHCIPLYDEAQVVVTAKDHLLTVLDEVPLEELDGEEFVLGRPPGVSPGRLDFPVMSLKDAIETAASGAGVAIVPQSVARLYHRKDAAVRPVPELAPTKIGLAWLSERDEEQAIQSFIGIVRGRTARSSR